MVRQVLLDMLASCTKRSGELCKSQLRDTFAWLVLQLARSHLICDALVLVLFAAANGGAEKLHTARDRQIGVGGCEGLEDRRYECLSRLRARGDRSIHLQEVRASL